MNKILCLIIILTLSVVVNLQHFKNRNLYELRFLNVGQGDATFIKTPIPNTCRILIDGGPSQAFVQKIRHLLPSLSKEIDILILTHPHADHMAGFLEILHRLKIKEIWLTGVAAGNADYNYLVQKIQQNPAIKIKYITKQFTQNICGIQFKIFWPHTSLIGKNFDNLNNSSIVLQLKIKDTKILFTGDAEFEQEQELLQILTQQQLLDLKSDILQAGHHGSKTSNTIEFLQAVNPKYMIISAGKDNRYNHPNFETIQKANLLNIKILRTDWLDAKQDIIFFF